METGRFCRIQYSKTAIIDPRRNEGDLELFYSIAGKNNIQPTRLSAYAQYSQKFYWGAVKYL
jgi:hypothetical protein